MSALQQGTPPAVSWKDVAIKNAGAIADGWEVFIAYGAQFAAWILFFCMVSNIVQMLPHVNMPDVIINAIMGIQVVTLDIAGFGLNTLAKSVAKHGDDEAKAVAQGAKRLGLLLISVMILTLLLIAVGWLFPTVKVYTDMADKVLILGRVILTVVYMHTMHDLREAQSTVQNMIAQAAQEKSELIQRWDVFTHFVEKRLHDLEAMTVSTQQSSISEAQISGLIEDHLQTFFVGLSERQNEQIETLISQLFDRLKSEGIQERNTDELLALIDVEITPEIPDEKEPEIMPVIPDVIEPVKEEKKAPDYSDIIAKFPLVNEWLLAGLRSVSIDQIIEVTNFSKAKISRAKLAQTRNGNKRIENVLNWLRNEPVKKEVNTLANNAVKKEEKKAPVTQPLSPRITQPLSPVMVPDFDDDILDSNPCELESELEEVGA